LYGTHSHGHGEYRPNARWNTVIQTYHVTYHVRHH